MIIDWHFYALAIPAVILLGLAVSRSMSLFGSVMVALLSEATVGDARRSPGAGESNYHGAPVTNASLPALRTCSSDLMPPLARDGRTGAGITSRTWHSIYQRR